MLAFNWRGAQLCACVAALAVCAQVAGLELQGAELTGGSRKAQPFCHALAVWLGPGLLWSLGGRCTSRTQCPRCHSCR